MFVRACSPTNLHAYCFHAHVCVEEGRVGGGLHSYPGSWWAGYEAREGMVNMLEEANEILEYHTQLVQANKILYA